MTDSKRTDWIDTARAIAMLLVIAGHISNELTADGFVLGSPISWLLQIGNSIKLPLFFAISGYLFSPKNTNPALFFRKLFQSRLIPYFVWGSFMGIIAFLMDFLRCGFDSTRIVFLLMDNYILPFLRGNLIWFIPCLMVMECCFFLLLKFSRKDSHILILLTALCTVSGYLLSSDGTVKFWKFDTALCCIQFMTLGYLIRNLFDAKLSLHTPQKRFFLFGAFYLLILSLNLLLRGNITVNVNTGVYFDPLGFTFLACSGIFAIFSLCQFLPTIPFILSIGRNTLLYFIWHMYVVKFILAVCLRFSLLSRLPVSLIMLITLVLSCAVVSVICQVINHYLWFTVGRKKAEPIKFFHV